jgi:hypothetical protein
MPPKELARFFGEEIQAKDALMAPAGANLFRTDNGHGGSVECARADGLPRDVIALRYAQDLDELIDGEDDALGETLSPIRDFLRSLSNDPS